MHALASSPTWATVRLALTLLLLSALLADAEVDCSIGGTKLASIAYASLSGTSSDDHLYNWQISLCQNNAGTVVQRDENDVINTFNLRETDMENGSPILRYATSIGKTLSLVVQCAPNKALAFTKGEPQVRKSGNVYSATLLHKAACVSNDKGCGGGCLFVVLFFVAVAVYVLGTVLWYYFKEGRRGADLIPHREFWLDFPILLKDGFMFLVNKIRALMGGASHVTYEEM